MNTLTRINRGSSANANALLCQTISAEALPLLYPFFPYFVPFLFRFNRIRTVDELHIPVHAVIYSREGFIAFRHIGDCVEPVSQTLQAALHRVRQLPDPFFIELLQAF